MCKSPILTKHYQIDTDPVNGKYKALEMTPDMNVDLKF